MIIIEYVCNPGKIIHTLVTTEDALPTLCSALDGSDSIVNYRLFRSLVKLAPSDFGYGEKFFKKWVRVFTHETFKK